MKHIVIALALGFAALAAAHAQPVYRCGNTYSQAPCPQARLVEATDPRSAAQRTEAARVAADERRLAAEMRRDRLADEAAHPPALATTIGAPAVAPIEPATKREPRSAKKKRVAARLIAANAGVAPAPAGGKSKPRAQR